MASDDERAVVDAAGDLLKQVIAPGDFRAPEVIAAFSVANDWRERHLVAMKQIRAQLAATNRVLATGGVTAARLKRMPAIRKKLRRFSYKLSELQDLGGCRVILPTLDDVRRFEARLQEAPRHHLRDVNDYIAKAKRDGYRSLHLLLDHRDDRFPEYRDLRIELQVRTHLQHAWATAVEALGLYLRVNIKSGGGSEEWRRLLMLMSCEFAESEGCEPVRGAPGGGERRREIIELDKALGAQKALDSLALGFRVIDGYVLDRFAKYLLLRFQHEEKLVRLETFSEAPAGARSYGDTERRLAMESLDDEDPANDALFVSLSQLNDLKRAFPNYFGDVRLFREQLRHICKGRGVATYDLPPQALAPPRRREIINPGWLRRPRFPKPRGA
jgi:hypothetical protein